MRRSILPFLSLALLGTTLSAAASTPKRHSTSAPQTRSHSSSTHASVRRVSARGRNTHSTHASKAAPLTGFRAVAHAGISDERATAIQSALISKGYLTGEPTGHWDQASISAMQKLQSDNGWQTKVVPDSRALIQLGLGSGSVPATQPTGTPTTATTTAPPTPQSY